MISMYRSPGLNTTDRLVIGIVCVLGGLLLDQQGWPFGTMLVGAGTSWILLGSLAAWMTWRRNKGTRYRSR